MEVTNISKTAFFIIAAGLLCISCEKEDQQTIVTEPQDEVNTVETIEGFKSTTGNSDLQINPSINGQKPLLYMHFDKSTSPEEAAKQFDEAADAIIAQETAAKKGVSTEWYFRIRTVTGKQTDNNTDGDVRAGVSFRTDQGTISANWLELDNFGDDREKGDHDYYMFRKEFPKKPVSWVEVTNGYLMLKGTDGWFITNYDVWMYPSYQSKNSINSSRFNSSPNVWLDNNRNKNWDRFDTGEIGIGRLSF